MYFISLINCLLCYRNKKIYVELEDLVIKWHRSSIMTCREVTKIHILRRTIVHRKMI